MTAEASRRAAASRSRAASHLGNRVTDDERKARLLAAIRRHSRACGCEAASLSMIGAAVSFLAYLTLGDAAWTAGEALRLGGVWVLSWTLLGKAGGLGYARIRLLVLRSTLRREFGNPG